MNTSSDHGLINKGLAVINPSPCGAEATFVVVGLPRSGTSMLSSLLKGFGIFIGEAVDSAVYEDVEVARFIDAKDYKSLKTFIETRNGQHAVWSFKRPNAYRVLPKIIPLLRNPRVIVMFRDVLAIAMRNHVSMQMSLVPSLPRYAEEYRDLVEIIASLTCPMLLVSYEKFIQFPKESIERTAEFAGVSVPPDLMEQMLSMVRNGPEIYLKASRLHYRGHVDRIVQGKLRGWAMVIDQPKLKANVQVRINGAVVRNDVAELFRPDLLSSGIGDGHHGFEIEIGSAITPDSLIEVMAGNAEFALAGSGKKAAAYGFM